jgi:hypothetical protein
VSQFDLRLIHASSAVAEIVVPAAAVHAYADPGTPDDDVCSANADADAATHADADAAAHANAHADTATVANACADDYVHVNFDRCHGPSNAGQRLANARANSAALARASNDVERRSLVRIDASSRLFYTDASAVDNVVTYYDAEANNTANNHVASVKLWHANNGRCWYVLLFVLDMFFGQPAQRMRISQGAADVARNASDVSSGTIALPGGGMIRVRALGPPGTRLLIDNRTLGVGTSDDDTPLVSIRKRSAFR